MARRSRLVCWAAACSTFAATGCGGTDWSGRFQGTVNSAYECDSGFKRSEIYDYVWTIEPASDARWGVIQQDTEVCPEFTLNEAEEADVALVEAVHCGPGSNEDYDLGLFVDGGRIMLRESSIDVDVRYRYELSPNQLGRSKGLVPRTCDDRHTGTLTKLAE